MAGADKHERFAHSVAFSAIGTVASRAINVIGTLVLARILSPNEFGLLAIVSMLTALSLLFVDVGLGAALVHAEKPSRKDYSTVFTFNVVIAATLAAGLYGAAPALGRFFGDADAIAVIRVAALLLVANGLMVVPNAILQKARRFRPIAMAEVVSSVLALAVAIALAIAGFGVWALIANLYVVALLKFLMLAIYSGWVPTTWPSVKSFTALWSYSGYLFGSGILDYIETNADKIVVGRYFDSKVLGSYDLASKLTLLPAGLIISVLGRVLFPTYVAGREDTEEVGKVHIEVVQLVAFFLIPLMLALSVHADPLVRLLLGTQWSEAAIFISVLSLVYILRAFAALSLPIVLALGATRMHFGLALFSAVVVIASVLLGVQFGVSGLLVALLVGRVIIAVPVLALPSRLIGLSFRAVIASLVPPVAAGVLAVIVTLAMRDFLIAQLQEAIGTSVSLVLFAGVYFAVLRLVWGSFLNNQVQRLSPLVEWVRSK